jgi:hypothetical protein
MWAGYANTMYSNTTADSQYRYIVSLFDHWPLNLLLTTYSAPAAGSEVLYCNAEVLPGMPRSRNSQQWCSTTRNQHM